MQFGSLHRTAAELRVQHWIDGEGQERPPLALQELGEGMKILFCFQHACPGCHSRGFPVLRYLHHHLAGTGVGFAAIQTVFEDFKDNTVDKLAINQQRYQLAIPFGHDVAREGETYPSFMQDYRSAGTPWFTIIDADNQVIFADFSLDPRRFIEALGHESVAFDAD